MRFLRRLSFQNKILLITLAMVALVVVTGAIAIDRVILPAMEADVTDGAWKIARGVVDQVRELPDGDGEAQLRASLKPLFAVMPKLLHVELLDRNDSPTFWMGDDECRTGTGADGFDVVGGMENVLVKRPTSGNPVYQVLLRDPGPSPPETELTVRVGVCARSLEQISVQLFRVLFTVTLLVLAISFFLTRGFTRMITRPVDRLMRMTASLARGELEDVVREVERELPCREKLQDDLLLRDLGDSPGLCPLLIGEQEKGAAREKEPPHPSCGQCDFFRYSSGDELSSLTLGFKVMAARLRAYQKQLQQHYEFEERLLDACPDGIMANDRDGLVILYNKGAQRLLDYTPEEVLHKLPVQDLYAAGEAQAIKKALLSDEYGGPGTLLDYTTSIVGKDGRTIPIRLSAALLFKDGEELAVVGYFQDLTELRRHMSKLVEANIRLNEANERFSRLNRRYLEMLSFVTHELKSPIANSYMSANALRQEVFGELAREQSLMVEAICRNLEQSMEMIKHYLDLSRIEKDELPVQPRPARIMDEVVQPVIEGLGGTIVERRVSICVDVPPELQWNLDPELFRSVLGNLVNNALKYGDESGRIRITVADLGDRCRMEVWNSGPGISAEDRGRLFRKFERLHTSRQLSTRGTGLGLFITKTIVERHGGRIWVESLEGEWTAFIIEVPRD
ncbi:MAG: PAS domain-containing sensor histidine kinase [Syntrophobacteraceae bacterium]|jgi:PAS domain S-box-containing protein|nr:PAS domain-containing sensor histidine kinase [Syntrophobacteraceae bacterium]